MIEVIFFAQTSKINIGMILSKGRVVKTHTPIPCLKRIGQSLHCLKGIGQSRPARSQLFLEPTLIQDRLLFTR